MAANNQKVNPDVCFIAAEHEYDYIKSLIFDRTLGLAWAFPNRMREILMTGGGKEMMKYYRKAAKLGHSKAKKRIEKLERYL